MFTKLMKFIAFFLFFLTEGFSTENLYSIVFVYIGNIPQYLECSISQARLFNPDATIYLIGNKNSLDNLHSKKIDDALVQKIACESLKKSHEHQLYDDASRNKQNYWKFTTERFIYISELMSQYNLKNVFQIECDVMLYVNLGDILNVFCLYSGIAAPFQTDNLGSASFTYFANPKAAKSFAEFIPKYAEKADMEILALFKNFNTAREIDYLPIIFKEYANDQPLMNAQRNITTTTPWKFYNHIEEFNSIFDADLLGTYIIQNPGIIGNQVVYNPALIKVIWIKDSKGRNVPYVKYKKVQYRLNTLHIYLKRLNIFSSLNQVMQYPQN
jgi:hypothetical protein